MANNNKTVFQRLTDVVIGVGNGSMSVSPDSVTYNMKPDEVLYSFDNKEERDAKLLQLKQEKLLAYQWKKIAFDSNIEQMAGATQVRVMYRDADLMDTWPEINAALYIIAEEATTLKEGKVLNVYSKSPRIKAVLEDLFINRLDVNIMLPMIVRATAKYGNEFMCLNVDQKNGVLGWRELPVYEMKRIEAGMNNGYGGAAFGSIINNMCPDEVQFVWEGHNDGIPYKSWQIAHFRLIQDSLFLPYGVSHLNGARRSWRMLSMMEDAMLLYRLERSIERRMFKVNVGNMDDTDVKAYLQQFMNNVKRAPIIDPKTGQMDLRKNYLDVSADYVIPVRQGQDPSDIQTLQSAQNQTSMDDIKYMENKILTLMRVPKSFLNFQDAQGRGQNMSLMDIRFNRMINTIQQAIILELNKIAIEHLYLLGFEDDLTNFQLTLNNPSNQIEMFELQNMQQRVQLASNALQEQGGGISIMSWHQVQREIMGKTDAEISIILNEIRLEKAMANEIQNTANVITHTGMFDKVDRLYGIPNFEDQQNNVQQGNNEGGNRPVGGGAPFIGGGGFDGGMSDFGNDIEGGDISGEEGSIDLGDESENDNIESNPNNGEAQPLLELIKSENGLLEGTNASKYQFFNKYLKNTLKENIIDNGSILTKKNVKINERIDNALNELDELINKNEDK